MKTNDTKYTVLSYNMGSYEIVHPVLEKSDRARYIMVTDDPNLEDPSGTWEIVVDDTLTGTPFDKTLQVRYNPWKYTDDYVVLRIDGSVGINKSLDKLIDRFLDEEYDMSLMSHPGRQTILEEYTAWVQTRQYPVENANRILSFMAQAEGFNVKDWKGLCQMCYFMQRRTRISEEANRMVYTLCKYLADNTGIERVDQCIASFVFQKYFSNAKIMWVDQRMYQSDFLTWYPHHSDVPFKPMDVKDMKEPYWLNKRLHNPVRPQDL